MPRQVDRKVEDPPVDEKQVNGLIKLTKLIKERLLTLSTLSTFSIFIDNAQVFYLYRYCHFRGDKSR